MRKVICSFIILALGLLAAAEDTSCASGDFRLRIYSQDCDKIKVQPPGDSLEEATTCGAADFNIESHDYTDPDGKAGYDVIGDVTIKRDDIKIPVDFAIIDTATETLSSTVYCLSLCPYPKSRHGADAPQCTLSFEVDPCERNLRGYKGWGLDFEGHDEREGYDFKGADTLKLSCVGGLDLRSPPK
jgi:hypothetical protein